MSDGLRVKFWSADRRQQNVLRLIDAFGGFVPRGGGPTRTLDCLAS